jgi:hypothetical protein
MTLLAKISTTLDDRSARLAGIGLMLVSVAMFSFGDALGKYIVATYSVGQLMFLRSCAALALLAPSMWQRRGEFRQLERPWLQLLRVVLSTLEIAAFFLATVYLPLADVVTYYLATPIFVTALSAIFLRERVGWRRWSAILIGFLGVVIALRPSAQSISWPAMIALAGSLSFSCSLLATRLLRATADRLDRPELEQSWSLLRCRRHFGMCAALRQPFAEARARQHDRAVSIYDDHLGGDVRLCRVRRRAVVADGSRGGHHHRRRSLYFLARAAARTHRRGGESAGLRKSRRIKSGDQTRRVEELFQFFSEAQMPRVSRKQSTGVDDPSASKRCSSTPLHWKPHFSSTLREAGLATRAPAHI